MTGVQDSGVAERRQVEAERDAVSPRARSAVPGGGAAPPAEREVALTGRSGTSLSASAAAASAAGRGARRLVAAAAMAAASLLALDLIAGMLALDNAFAGAVRTVGQALAAPFAFVGTSTLRSGPVVFSVRLADLVALAAWSLAGFAVSLLLSARRVAPPARAAS